MCGLFGVVNYSRAKPDMVSRLVKALADESTSRGTDAGGVAYYGDKGLLTVVKNHKSIKLNGVLDFEDIYKSAIIMGHTRATTQGLATKNQNNHPFMGDIGNYALAHNGVLSNDEDVMSVLKLTDNDVETDSYVLVRMLDQLHGGVVSFETLRDCGEKLGGTYNFTVLDGDGNLWVLRHNNPLVIIDFKELGLIAYASTGDIMMDALNSYYGGSTNFTEYLFERRSVVPFGNFIHTVSGDILKIDRNGGVTRDRFEPSSKVISDPNRKYKYSYYTDAKGVKHWYQTGYNDSYEDDMLNEYATYYRKKEPFIPVVEKKDDITFYNRIFGLDGNNVNSRMVIWNGRELEDVELDSGRYVGECFSNFLGEYIEIPNGYFTVPSRVIRDGITFNELLATVGNYKLSGADFGLFIQTINELLFVFDLIDYIKSRNSKAVAKEIIKLMYLYLYIRTGASIHDTNYSHLEELVYGLWVYTTFVEMYEHMVSFVYYEYYDGEELQEEL
jgi:predicted glutamine amidotransferase